MKLKIFRMERRTCKEKKLYMYVHAEAILYIHKLGLEFLKRSNITAQYKNNFQNYFCVFQNKMNCFFLLIHILKWNSQFSEQKAKCKVKKWTSLINIVDRQQVFYYIMKWRV